MFAIRVCCPHCGAKLTVPARYAGTGGRCSGCRRPLTIPAAKPVPWLYLGVGVLGVLIVGSVLLAVALAKRPGPGGDPNARGSGVPDGDAEYGVGVRRALLIGVNEYPRDRELRELQYPVRDVEKLRDVLAERGYAVTLLATGGTEPTRSAIVQAFETIRKQSKRGDTLLVAFAGHGTQPADTFYFCPSDARLGETGTLVSINQIYDEMKALPDGFKLLLADACRDRPPDLARGSGADEPDPKARTLKALPAAPENITAFYSCSAGEQAFEHASLKHGVFFHFVIEGLSGKADFTGNGEVTVPKLQEYVQREVFSFVDRHLRRRQRPAVQSHSNNNRAIVKRDATVTPQPAPLPADDEYWVKESFAGARPAGWEAAAFAVERPANAPPYLKLTRGGGRHYATVLRNRDLGDHFFVECEFVLGDGQALELVLAGEGTPGVSFLVRGDGAMAFPGTRPTRPEAFRRGQRNRLRMKRHGDRFQVAVNDASEFADCEYVARMPRRLSGLSLGYVTTGAGQFAMFQGTPAMMAGGAVPVPWGLPPGMPVNVPPPPFMPMPVPMPVKTAATAFGIYALNVGPLPARPDDTVRHPPKMGPTKLAVDFAQTSVVPKHWAADDFAVLREDAGRPALMVTSNRAAEFTASVPAAAFGGGFDGDFWLELEYASGTADRLRLEFDALKVPIKVPMAGNAEAANRVQRLFVSRVAGVYLIVADGKDDAAEAAGDPQPPPVREIRLVMKGVKDEHAVAPRVYSIRGGELEPGQPVPRAVPPEPVAAKPNALQFDCANPKARGLAGWEFRGVPLADVDALGQRGIGLSRPGSATLKSTPVKLDGDFTASLDYTVAPNGRLHWRFLSGASDFFDVVIDGKVGALMAKTEPFVKLDPAPIKLLPSPNTVRVSRKNGAILIEHNGGKANPVNAYPLATFDRVEVELIEAAESRGRPRWTTAVTKMSVGG